MQPTRSFVVILQVLLDQYNLALLDVPAFGDYKFKSMLVVGWRYENVKNLIQEMVGVVEEDRARGGNILRHC